MSMKRKAMSSIIVAGSMVMMCAVADTNATVSAEKVTVTAAGVTAGVFAEFSHVEAEAVEEIHTLTAGVNPLETILVASAEEKSAENENSEALPEVQMNAETEKQNEAASEETESARASEEISQEEAETQPEQDVQETADAQPKAQSEELESVQPEAGAEAENDVPEVQPDEEWQGRLMADVDEFLYVRASGEPEAEIVGKLYKGAVAEIVEEGEEWTQVVSGNVEGYVSNEYCVSGNDALDYAKENVEIQATIETDGLRVRKEAQAEAPVLTAVSTGTTLAVDPEAETDEEWVAVKYNGETAYVSAEYVTTDFALGEAVTIEEERAAAEKAAAEKAAQEAKAAAEKAAQQTKAAAADTSVQHAAVSASTDDVTLLAAIIQCEAGSEPFEGQVAVGAVVMNRVRSGAYPGSIYGVIYQPGQFPPAAKGMVASIASAGPKASCIQAAQQALAGADNTGGAKCFSRAGSRGGVVIGNHVFY